MISPIYISDEGIPPSPQQQQQQNHQEHQFQHYEHPHLGHDPDFDYENLEEHKKHCCQTDLSSDIILDTGNFFFTKHLLNILTLQGSREAFQCLFKLGDLCNTNALSFKDSGMSFQSHLFYEPFVLCVALFDKKNSPKQKPTTIGYLQYSCVGVAVNGARHILY